MVFRALSASGKAQGNVAQLSFILVPGRVTMHGRTVVPALGYGSPVDVQMVDASRAVATGDFAMLGTKVDGILDALATHDIPAAAVHSHLIGEQRRVPIAIEGLRERLERIESAVEPTAPERVITPH